MHKGKANMSLKRIKRILECLGLSPAESKVYVYVAKSGPQTVKAISLALGMSKQQLCSVLTKLKERGLVVSASQRSTVFSALSFGEVLDKYIESNINVAQEIVEDKKDIIDCWREMTK